MNKFDLYQLPKDVLVKLIVTIQEQENEELETLRKLAKQVPHCSFCYNRGAILYDSYLHFPCLKTCYKCKLHCCENCYKEHSYCKKCYRNF